MNDIKITEAEEFEQITGELNTLKKQNTELSQAGFELISYNTKEYGHAVAIASETKVSWEWGDVW